MAVRNRLSMVRNVVGAVRIATRPGSPTIGTRLAAVPRLVRATMSGQYTGTTLLRLAALGGAVAYLVSPIDLVPEGFLLVLGLADDAVVLSWFAATLVNETESFLAWEQGEQVPTDTGAGRRTVPGRVIR